MNITNIALASSTALLYPLFFSKLIDVINDRKSAEESCYNSDMTERRDFEQCNNKRTEKLRKIDTQRFAMLLSVGIVAIVLSYFIDSPGISLGMGLCCTHQM